MKKAVDAEHFEKLEKDVKEAVRKQFPDEWWQMWWDWLTMYCSDIQIKELKRLASTPYLQLVR